MSAQESLRGGRNLLTPHSSESYPDLRVIRPGEWDMSLIVPEEGQTIVALGGEVVYPYDTIDGGHAQGFELRRGDRAMLVRTGLQFEMAHWLIERAPA